MNIIQEIIKVLLKLFSLQEKDKEDNNDDGKERKGSDEKNRKYGISIRKLKNLGKDDGKVFKITLKRKRDFLSSEKYTTWLRDDI